MSPCAYLGCSSNEQPKRVHYLRTHFSAEDELEAARVCGEHVPELKERIRENTDKTPIAVTDRMGTEVAA